jgi:hypothetical protein
LTRRGPAPHTGASVTYDVVRACARLTRRRWQAKAVRALQWDVLIPVLAGIVVCAAAEGPRAAQPAVQSMTIARGHAWAWPGVSATYVQDSPAVGLERAVLRVTEGGRTRDIALDGTRTGARARGIASARFLPDYRRILLHLDPEHDAAGLLVVDLGQDSVVDAVTGRDLTPSPDGRFWAFEEHASRIISQWPHTETVYAVYDAAAPPAANARPCPTHDDRCRGQVVFLPDRLARCHAIAKARGGSCLTPGRQPTHGRRSPFVWLAPNEVAWVDADRERQVATVVVATLTGGLPARVRPVVLEPESTVDAVGVPPVREEWMVDRITRDAGGARLWLHFRTRVPEAPLQRVGVRLS